MKRRRSLYAQPEIRSEESSAPGRGLMSSGAGQLSRGGGGQGRGAGAVTAEPSWVAAGREDVRTPARPVVALSASSGPPWDVRPTGRADVQRPRVRCPVSRASGCPVHPGVRTDRPAVSAALPPRCPRRAGPWSGSVWRAAPVGRSESTCPVVCGRRGRLPASGLTGRDSATWPCLARTRVDRSPGPPLGRRPGCGAAWAAGPTTCAGPGQGAGQMAGEHGASRCSPAPCTASWAGRRRGADRGPGPGGGDHAGWSLGEGGPAASGSGGPLGSVGEQPAAAARPRRVRSAIRQVRTGP
jgi:hypothetical protein